MAKRLTSRRRSAIAPTLSIVLIVALAACGSGTQLRQPSGDLADHRRVVDSDHRQRRRRPCSCRRRRPPRWGRSPNRRRRRHLRRRRRRSRRRHRRHRHPAPTTPPPTTGETYAVVGGDTLFGISRKLGVTLDAPARRQQPHRELADHPGPAAADPGRRLGAGHERADESAGDEPTGHERAGDERAGHQRAGHEPARHQRCRARARRRRRRTSRPRRSLPRPARCSRPARRRPVRRPTRRRPTARRSCSLQATCSTATRHGVALCARRPRGSRSRHARRRDASHVGRDHRRLRQEGSAHGHRSMAAEPPGAPRALDVLRRHGRSSRTSPTPAGCSRSMSTSRPPP